MDTPDAMTDAELLRAWSGRRCQPSFRALVEKYLGLVQGVAMRRTGDPALAGDVAQAVFSKLAAKAARITAQPTLAPWLHHCASCESTSAIRRESTRSRHMKAYAHHLRTAGDPGSPTPLQDALPHLDAALQSLPREDQRIVLMRFFEGRGLRDIASSLGKTEAAVRKQGQRALETLALRLRRRGVGLSTAALAAALGAVLSQPAQAAAVTAISTSAITAGAKLSLLDQVLTLMNTKTKTAVITAACMALPLIWQWQRAGAMEDQLAASSRETRSLRAANAMLRSPDILRSGRSPAGNSGSAGTAASGTAADWEAALKHPDPLQRMTRLAALTASLKPETALEVSRLFKRLREENGGKHLFEAEQRNFLRAWGRLDGRAAMAGLSDEKGQPNDSGESLAALAGWAQSSPAEARTWLESLSPGDTTTALALGLIDGWSLGNFDEAAAYAASLPRSTARDQFRSLLLQRALAAGGAPEAQRWFTGIPNDQHNQLYKERAFDELIAALMTRDPSGAAVWITRMGRQEFMNGDAVPQLAARLASSSPAEALHWLETLGPGNGKGPDKTNEGYGQVLDTWASKDPVAAGTWLQSQTGHPAYDNMAAAYAKQLAASDATSALAWADSIQNEGQRSAARDEAARALLRSPNSDARGTLAAAGFTNGQMDKLTKYRSEMALYEAQVLLDVEQQVTLKKWVAAIDGRQMEMDRAREELRAARDAQAAADQLSAKFDGAANGLPAVDFSKAASTLNAGDPRYTAAHPNGAPANCSQCHQ